MLRIMIQHGHTFSTGLEIRNISIRKAWQHWRKELKINCVVLKIALAEQSEVNNRTHTTMKVIKSELRAVIERVTEIEVNMFGEDKRLFVFENLDRDGNQCHYWVQNWECEDITDLLNSDNHTKINTGLKEHYRLANR